MNIPVRQVLVASCLFLVLSLIVLGGLWYQQCHCQPYQNPQGNNKNRRVDLLCATMERPEALFALALVVCTVVSFGFISTQIAQANAAIDVANSANDISTGALLISKKAHQLAIDGLKETRRSVDAFVEAERGRMFIHSVNEQPGRDELSLLHFTMENIGRGICIVTGEWNELKYLAADAEIPVLTPPVRLSDVFVVLAPGQTISTRGVRGQEIRVPIPIPRRPEWAALFVFQYVLRYDTAFGQTRLAGFTWVAEIDKRMLRRVQTDSYNFDYPADFDFSKRP